MQLTDCLAPSYTELRPFKLQRTKTFPVYPDLVDKLVSALTHPDEKIAHVMAVCSAYAYSDVQTVAMIMARMGLEENRCVMIDEYVDALFITCTSFLIQSKDGRAAILCYRGTPPTSLITWLTDANVDPTRIGMPSPLAHSGEADREDYVHGGFYRNVRSTRYEIFNALKRAIKGESIRRDGEKLDHELQALYITGHSLGAASASMLALMLVAEPGDQQPIVDKLKAVYTFGGPMLASPHLARDCNKHEFLHDRVIRYVYANDVLPQLPPKASYPFAHFGTGYQYTRKPRRKGDPDWRQNDAPHKQLRSLWSLALAPLSLVTSDIKKARRLHFRASLNDHLPQHYVDAVKPKGIRSEFGD